MKRQTALLVDNWVCCRFVPFTQSQPEMEYSLPELQAPRSNVADKPWPQVHSHTQRPHGVKTHAQTHACTSPVLLPQGCANRALQRSLVFLQVWGDMASGERPRLEAKGSAPSNARKTPQLSTTSSAACRGELFEIHSANPSRQTSQWFIHLHRALSRLILWLWSLLVSDSFALQTLRPPAVDFSGLPFPVHHGHAVAQLRQPRHCARAAHQDAGTYATVSTCACEGRAIADMAVQGGSV